MVKKEEPKRLVLLDAHALIHRAFHALPPLNTARGELVNAVFGFLSILLGALKELKPKYVAATFDLPKPTFRHEQFADYKATRVKAPDELYNQIGRVKEALAAFNIPFFEKEGFEADDLLGTICKQLEKEKNLEIYLVTGDLDTLQLVNKQVKIFTPKKGIKDTQVYDLEAVQKRFGLTPSQMPDFKGLKGDPSDNIPGVPGVGEKTATKLLQTYKNLEGLFAKLEKSDLADKLKIKLKEFEDQAFFSRELSLIRLDAPINFNLQAALWHDFDKNKAGEFLEKMRFFSLIKRLDEILNGKFTTMLPMAKQEETKKSSVHQEIESLFKQKIFSKQIYETEKALEPVLRAMEKEGIKLDVAYLRHLDKEVSQDLQRLEKEIYQLTGGTFNINSPQQLSEVLFSKLKIEVLGLKKTPGKVISTAFSELLKLREKHPVIDKIIKYRELAKLKNTYIDSLPKLTDANSRLHTSFDQLGTTTGRLSSKEPNLQNIPVKTELGSKIRNAFVAEDGFFLVSADYSQIELRVVASIAKDQEMIKLLKEGHDVHAATAAEVFGVASDKVTPKSRKAAKVLNFGMIYGMSIKGFAEAAGLARADAKKFMDNYFATFKGIANYIETTKKKVAQDGFVETVFGRKRFIPEINSSVWNLKAAAERMAINMPVQGTAADIIKMSMTRLAEKITVKGWTDKIRMLLQVHDELVFEVKKEFLSEAAELIKQTMEEDVSFEVPLTVELKSGQRWGEMKKLAL